MFAVARHRLASLLRFLAGDHLRRPRGAHELFRAHTPTRKHDRFAAGAQIIRTELTGTTLDAPHFAPALDIEHATVDQSGIQSRCS